MTLTLKDRVRETTTTTGTGTLTLLGAATGCQSFSAVGDGNTCYYVIDNGTDWEVGIGTYTASGTTLSRDTVLASSNSGSAVNWSSGTKNVYCTLPSERAIVGSGGNAFSWASLSVVARLVADDISGSDGDVVTSWALRAGTAAAFEQSTVANKPLLKKAANGINSRNVVRFDGSNDSLSAATGGASLASPWYVALVAKFSSLTGFQHLICWGDDTTDERRGILKWGSGAPFTTNAITWNGKSTVSAEADVGSTFVPTVNVACFVEVTYDGTTLNIYANGTLVGTGTPTFASFTNTAIYLGQNVGGTELFAGDFAEVIALSAIPSAADWLGIRSDIASRYNLTITNSTQIGALASFTGTGLNVVGESNVYQDASENIIIGATTPLTTRNTGLTVTNTCTLSGIGSFNFFGTNVEHEFGNNWASQNTLSLWNKNTGGFSAIRFRRTGSTGEEMAAVGYGVGLEPWGAASTGSLYLETSNFNDTSKYGILRIIQTKASGNHYSTRMEFKENGDIVFYDQADYTGQAAFLTIKVNGDIVSGSAAIATNATAGFLYVPGCAGTPTGTPTTYTGRVPICVDTTNHKLYFYSGGSWRDAGP